MNDSREFLSAVNWETNISNVVLLSDETEEQPAVWLATVRPVDRNDDGSDLDIEIDDGLVDNAGNIFRIVDNEFEGVKGIIAVSDVFRCGWCPQPDLTAIIYKSVGDGVAPHIAPAKLRRLDRNAIDRVNNIEKDILWKFPNNINQTWSPDGIVFSSDADNENIINWTAGKIIITLWPKNLRSDFVVDNVVGHNNYHPEKRFTVQPGTFTCSDNELYYIYFKFSTDQNTATATILITKSYLFERYYSGHILVCMGKYNVPNPKRSFAMDWGNALNPSSTKTTDNTVNNYYDITEDGQTDFVISPRAIKSSIRVYRNLSRLHPSKYSITGNILHIYLPLLAGETIRIFFDLWVNNLDIFNEIPTGDIDGINQDFFLQYEPDPNSLELYKNGELMQKWQYAIEENKITTIIQTNDGDTLLADYSTCVVDGKVYNEEPIGDINGINTVFTLLNVPETGTVRNYHNGKRQVEGLDITIVGDQITYAVAPWTNDEIINDYDFT